MHKKNSLILFLISSQDIKNPHSILVYPIYTWWKNVEIFEENPYFWFFFFNFRPRTLPRYLIKESNGECTVIELPENLESQLLSHFLRRAGMSLWKPMASIVFVALTSVLLGMIFFFPLVIISTAWREL